MTTSPKPLGALQLAAYGVPNFAVALVALAVYAFLPNLYTQELGLNLALVAAVLAGTRILDAVTDPLIGYLSDHTPGRFGRRKPWMWASVPILMLAAWQLFLPPEGAGALHLALWATVLTLAWTMLILPYNAWGAELSGDYNGRTTIAGARQLFALIGTLVAAGLPAALAFWGHEGLRAHTGALGLVFLCALPLTVLIATLSLPKTPSLSRTRLPFFQGVRVAAGNAPFRRLIAAFFVNAIANGIPVTLFVPFVTHRLGMPDAYGPLLLAYFCAGLLGIPFWIWLSRHIGKHRSWAIAMIAASGAFLWTPILVGAGDFGLFLAITVFSGFSVGADLALPAAMQADVVDLDTARSGEERTGFFFALWGLSSKIALAASIGLAFGLLAFWGFEADALGPEGSQNTPTALNALAWIYAGLPVALKLFATALMWGFPLTEDVQRKIRADIEAAKA